MSDHAAPKSAAKAAKAAPKKTAASKSKASKAKAATPAAAAEGLEAPEAGAAAQPKAAKPKKAAATKAATGASKTKKPAAKKPAAKKSASAKGESKKSPAKTSATKAKTSGDETPAKAGKKAPAKAGKKPAASKKAAARPKRKLDLPPDVDMKGKTLVIVESPAKAKTINKYLGNDYLVTASMGHIRDLPGSDMGISIQESFRPTYTILDEKEPLVTRLKKLAKSADRVAYACDPDREGEAIAWHLAEALGSDKPQVRVTFNEITKSAVEKAFQNPRAIDMNKVNAQQARRILDRIVGYKLSPLLWRKVKPKLSAGRVQSVAVKILVQQERLIRAFKPEEYWRLDGSFLPLSGRAEDRFSGELHALGTGKLDPKGFHIENEARALAVYERLVSGAAQITRCETKVRPDMPSPPFITSTLQQAASTKLRFNTRKTMRVAQQLYEGIDLGGELGQFGLITYMRTDSVSLAKESVDAARSFIMNNFGDDYLPGEAVSYKTKGKSAQEAHEAIRPTRADLRPEDLASRLDDDQLKLYTMIWERFIGCQMTPAQYAHKTLEVSVTPKADAASAASAGVTEEGKTVLDERFDGLGIFRATGKTLVFDGHARVTGIKVKKDEPMLPELEDAQVVTLAELTREQDFTKAPPRYTEASLVKTLEEFGIGRPSTYSAIVETIQTRGYVRQENRKLFATPLGEIVTDRLDKHFAEIMDTEFTSQMEQRLDDIEETREDWVGLLEKFYGPFEKSLEDAMGAMKALNEDPEKTDIDCDKCGAKMVKMYNKRDLSRFLGCEKYPECKNTKPLDVSEGGKPAGPALEAEVLCDKCGKPMSLRKSRFGYFLGCTGYPDCKTIRKVAVSEGVAKPMDSNKAEMPKTDKICSLCSSPMVVRPSRRGGGYFLGCSTYPTCKNTEKMAKDGEDEQDEVGSDFDDSRDVPVGSARA
jgi:DNA topoisomerase-1